MPNGTKKDKDTYSVGDKVTLVNGTDPDEFYVIEDSDSSSTTIKLLSAKNIDITTWKQSSTANNVQFDDNSSDYWAGSTISDLVSTFLA